MASVVVRMLATQSKGYLLMSHPPSTRPTGKSIFTAAPPVSHLKQNTATKKPTKFASIIKTNKLSESASKSIEKQINCMNI